MSTSISTLNNPFKLLFSFQRNPYSFFDQVKPSNQHEIKKLKLGFKTFYFCYHPDHAKYFLEENKNNYPKSDLVLKKILPLSGKKGLIQLSDEEAKKVRQIAAKLMQPEKLQILSEKVSEFIISEFTYLDQMAKNNQIIDLKPLLTRLVLRTAGYFILGQDLSQNADKLNHAFVELNRMAGESLRSLISFPYSRKRNQYLTTIYQELDQIIDKSLGRPNDSLLKELKEQGFSRSFLHDQAKAFLFAGYDTTASSLIFAVDSVSRHLDVQDKINHEKNINFKNAKYTQAVYKESLRLYPSAYFLPRQVAADDFSFGQHLKKGSQLFISIRHIHQCKDIFANPNNFYPERFLEKLNHSHAFIPFGGGARICIGIPLAMMEATVLLQKLCERYKIIPAEPKPPAIEGLITAHTKSPLNVTLKLRN